MSVIKINDQLRTKYEKLIEKKQQVTFNDIFEESQIVLEKYKYISCLGKGKTNMVCKLEDMTNPNNYVILRCVKPELYRPVIHSNVILKEFNLLKDLHANSPEYILEPIELVKINMGDITITEGSINEIGGKNLETFLYEKYLLNKQFLNTDECIRLMTNVFNSYRNFISKNPLLRNGDLHYGNVLVDVNGKIKFIDFDPNYVNTDIVNIDFARIIWKIPESELQKYLFGELKKINTSIKRTEPKLIELKLSTGLSFSVSTYNDIDRMMTSDIRKLIRGDNSFKYDEMLGYSFMTISQALIARTVPYETYLDKLSEKNIESDFKLILTTMLKSENVNIDIPDELFRKCAKKIYNNFHKTYGY
jgi:hypothetical protein